MKRFLFLLALIPILGFGQSNTKYYTKKQEIQAYQLYADSVNSILRSEIATLLKDKETYKIELEKLHQKQEKIKIAIKYLKKAKRKTTVANIVTGLSVSVSVIGLIVLLPNASGNYIDLTEAYWYGGGLLIAIGQFISIPLKISRKENIQKAKVLITESTPNPSLYFQFLIN